MPDGWAWCRLRNFCVTIVDCPHSTPHYQTTPTSCWAIDTNCIDKNGFIIRKRFLGDNEFIARTKQCVPQGNDIIMSREGTIGLVAILPAGERICLGQRVMLLRPSSNCIPLYMRNTLATETFLAQFLSKSRGMGVQHINVEDIRNGFFPLPPLVEQQRIVEQIESLLKYVDIIDTDAETLEKSITLAKQKILDLAIRGKLVPQDPADEPASELLKKIKGEKDALVKAGKIKKDKHESYIFKSDDNCYYEQLNGKTVDITDEVPLDLPDTWRWCKLGNIGSWGAGATPSRNNKEYYQDGHIPWLKTGDLNDGDIYSVPEYITEKALRETSVQLNPVGSILIAMYGATIGKVGVLQIPATTNQACCACSVFNGINNRYLFLFLLSQKENFKTLGGGGAQPNISKDKIVNYLFPLPPREEQQRIVQAIAQYNSILELISK